VLIRIKGPSESGAIGDEGSGQAYINGFILEYFGASNKAPTNPSPAHRSENLCTWDANELTWTPGAGVVSQEIYFGSEINDVDPCASPVPTAVDTIGGTGSWVTPSLTGGVTYYWRVDSSGAQDVEGAIWKFTTNAGQAYDPYPENGWRGLPTDVNLAWSGGCGSTDQRVFFGTSELDVTNGTGGTDKGLTGGATTYDLPLLTSNTTYYWKIVSQPGGEISPIWSFKTGSGLEQMLLHYSFDDGASIGDPLPATLLDDTSNETFYTDVNTNGFPNAALDYGSSTIWGTVDSDESADFTPLAGLYRAGEAVGVDPLILDGYQYTLECWLNPDTLTDPEGDGAARDPGAILISMTGDDGDGHDTIWGLELSEPAGAIFVHRGTDSDRENMQIYSGRGTVGTGEWSHIAAVWDMTAQDSAKIYVNGQLLGASAKPYANPPDTNMVPTFIGFSRNGDDDLAFEGMLDEIKVHNHALEVSEFGLVPGPEWASNPDPAHNERRVDPNADLNWSAGEDAVWHYVYWGTSFDGVLNANTNSSEFQVKQAAGDEDFDPNTMEFGTSYYWRIDEEDSGSAIYSGMIWKFTVQSIVDDPNRLLWYQFNETSGNEAEDASGHDLVGAVGASDQWDPNDGDGGCLVLDEDSSVDIPGGALEYVYNGITISVWLKDSYSAGENNWLYDTAGSTIDIQIAVPDQNGHVYWRCGNDTEDVLTWDPLDDNIDIRNLEDWHHWAFTKSESEPGMSIYYDGEVVESNSTVSQSFIYLRNSLSKIGADGDNSGDFIGKIDDFIIFDYVLSENDVISLYRRGDVALAWKPDPRNGAIEIAQDANNLGWNPGDYAVSHDVYFGVDFDDVNDANNSLPVGTSVYKDNQTGTTYDLSGLTLGSTYYWRIDEVNNNDPCVWKGKVWKFTVANYLVIDDFESYIKVPDNLWYTWVNRGNQSMKYSYDITEYGWAFYAEVERNFASPQDWTDANVKVLTLYFYGHPNNDANSSEQMSIGLGDGDSNSFIDYDGDMNDIKIAEWQEWNIVLSDFTGVDM
ncbi:MAG: LamG domain-containing protein, partial [Planctomycetota bacterium]